jgi:hypothetical protein
MYKYCKDIVCILQKLIDSEDFQSNIKKQGYYASPKNYRTFIEYTQT